MIYFMGSGRFTNCANSNLDRLNFNLILMYFLYCCKEPDKTILYNFLYLIHHYVEKKRTNYDVSKDIECKQH